MTDSLNPTEAPLDGGLNSSDSAEWAQEKSPLRWPMIVLFGLPMIILAAGLALMVISFNLSHKPAPAKSDAVAVTAPVTTPVDKDAEIVRLQTQILALQSQAAQGNPAVNPAPVYADPSALSQMSARLDRLEANQRILIRAASSAYAARALQLAAKGSEPFLSELAVVEPTLDDPALVSTLRPFAEKGVPSEVTLAIQFPRIAAKANIAAKAAGANDSVISRIAHVMGSFISVRRTDNYDGQGAEATILRAETRINQGDLKGAVSYLTTLKPDVQATIKPWLDQAKARVLVDDATRRVSETALNRLSQMNSDQMNSDQMNSGNTALIAGGGQ